MTALPYRFFLFLFLCSYPWPYQIYCHARCRFYFFTPDPPACPSPIAPVKPNTRSPGGHVVHDPTGNICKTRGHPANHRSPASLPFRSVAFICRPPYQIDFLYNVNSSRDVGVLNSMDKRAKLELQLWASYRAQTLARTVRGIMYYDQAIRLLAVVSVRFEWRQKMIFCSCFVFGLARSGG